MSSGYVYNVKTDWSSGNLRFVDNSTGNAVFTVTAAGVTLGEGENIVLGTTTGTQIGTAAAQKLGFFGKTPRVQCAKASFNNWAAHTDIVTALVALGLFDAA
jgi:hypothetical protein